jgi:hypothetical protein
VSRAEQNARYREKNLETLRANDRERQRAAYRSVGGRPCSAETYIGQPCRACGSTERYVSSKNCVACQRRRFRSVTPGTYGIHLEFHNWITRAPASEIAAIRELRTE